VLYGGLSLLQRIRLCIPMLLAVLSLIAVLFKRKNWIFSI
jgi:hypothetical protein